MNEYILCSNCSMAECFPEKSSLCWNEQACQGVKHFEQSQRLDITLCRNLFILCLSSALCRNLFILCLSSALCRNLFILCLSSALCRNLFILCLSSALPALRQAGGGARASETRHGHLRPCHPRGAARGTKRGQWK